MSRYLLWEMQWFRILAKEGTSIRVLDAGHIEALERDGILPEVVVDEHALYHVRYDDDWRACGARRIDDPDVMRQATELNCDTLQPLSFGGMLRMAGQGVAMTQRWTVDCDATFVRRLGKSAAELGNTSQGKTCPDIWELSNGDIAVVGADMTEAFADRLPNDVSVGANERLVVIPRNMAVSAKPELPDA